MAFSSKRTAILKAAEWILAVGGFGLIVLDFADTRFIPQSAALRVARAAERSGAALIVLAEHRLCGTFAALSLALRPQRLHFSWTDFLTQLADSPARSGAPRASSNPLTQLADSPARSGAPRASTSVVVFDGITIAARVMRNKLGGSGRAAIWRAAADSLENLYTSHRCHPERNESASVVEGSTRSDSHRDRLSTASLIETPISSHLRAAV